jgi:hypothetical protein
MGGRSPLWLHTLCLDGIDSCRVGFLPRHLLKHSSKYDGILAQITEVYSKDSPSPTNRRKFHHNNGCCIAAIISSLTEDTISRLSANKKRAAAAENAAAENDGASVSLKKRRQQATAGRVRDAVDETSTSDGDSSTNS